MENVKLHETQCEEIADKIADLAHVAAEDAIYRVVEDAATPFQEFQAVWRLMRKSSPQHGYLNVAMERLLWSLYGYLVDEVEVDARLALFGQCYRAYRDAWERVTHEWLGEHRAGCVQAVETGDEGE